MRRAFSGSEDDSETESIKQQRRRLREERILRQQQTQSVAFPTDEQPHAPQAYGYHEVAVVSEEEEVLGNNLIEERQQLQGSNKESSSNNSNNKHDDNNYARYVSTPIITMNGPTVRKKREAFHADQPICSMQLCHFTLGFVTALVVVIVAAHVTGNIAWPHIPETTAASTPSISPPSVVSSSVHSLPVLDESWLSSRLPLIKPAFRDKCERLIRGDPSATFAQTKQDWFVWMNYFASMKEPGVYLDIGANDGMDISNTFFFDVCLGWSGVCVEPNSMYKASYAGRSCRLLPNCVSNEHKTIKFNFAGVVGAQDERAQTTAECLTLNEVLINNADILGGPDSTGAYGTKINYVTLDVEGAEIDILACFDFSTWSSLPQTQGAGQVWTIETALARERLNYIDSALQLGGFVKRFPLIQTDHTLIDDLYEMDRSRKWLRTPDTNCSTVVRKQTCSLYELLHGHTQGTVQCPVTHA